MLALANNVIEIYENISNTRKFLDFERKRNTLKSIVKNVKSNSENEIKQNKLASLIFIRQLRQNSEFSKKNKVLLMSFNSKGSKKFISALLDTHQANLNNNEIRQQLKSKIKIFQFKLFQDRLERFFIHKLLIGKLEESALKFRALKVFFKII